MKKNRGFTLVELLAVIVILAIIMIISIPTVMDTVTTSRKRSFSTYEKKAVVATETTNTEEEMMQRITGKGIYTYSIKDDLGLPATGSYDGYVVVDNCTQSEKQFYVYLADNDYMVYDFHDKDNADVLNSVNFGDYVEDKWQNVAGSKEKAASAVVNITGGYTCTLYGKNSSEVLGNGGNEIPGLPTSSNAAVFLNGVDFNYTMINEVAGNKDIIIVGSGTTRIIRNKKWLEPDNKLGLPDLVDTTIKEFKRAKSMSDEQKSSSKIVSTADSPNPIYMWFDSGTIYWYTDATKVFANKDASYMLGSLGGVTTLDVSEIDFSQTTNIHHLFQCDKNITSIDVSSMNVVNVTNMAATFYCMKALTSLDISMWNTSNATEVAFMFGYMEKATSIKFPKTLVNKKVNSMYGLFFCDYAVTSLDVSQFDTSNVSDFYGVFVECYQVKTLDVSNWNTSKATRLDYMFEADLSLTSLDLSKWNTSNVTDMSNMFRYAEKLTSLDLSNFDVSKVTDFTEMFSYMAQLRTLDLSNWHLGSNVNTTEMFRNDKQLKTIYVSESWKSHIGTDTNMFLNCTKLVGGNGTKYSSTVNKSMAIIDGEDGRGGYFTKKEV